jgi:hypothetical protein
MQGLDECGIRYLTASAIQTWRDSPAIWALGALFGLKNFQVPQVARHIAVRDGLRMCLHYASERAGEDVALGVYNRKLREWGLNPLGEAERSEEDIVLALLECHVKEFQRLGLFKKPLAYGIASAVLVVGLDTPLLSVADFVFDNAQVKVKTGKQVPSKPKPREMAALALDSLARPAVPAHVIYATHKRAATYTPTLSQLCVALEQLRMDAIAIETLVKTAQSPEHLLAMLPLNQDHFMWKPQLQAAALRILHQSREEVDGLIRAEKREFSEGSGRQPHLHLLPHVGPGDAESDLEWGD